MTLPLCSALLCAALAAPGDRVADWTEDVLHLVDEIQRLHPDPFFATPREEFEAGVDAFLAGIETRSDDEVVVELMRLVALLAQHGRDGHSSVWSNDFTRLPLQLYRFDDGWFVVAARAPAADLVGAKLLAIGGKSMEELVRLADPLVTKDNEWSALLRISLVLVTPEILHVLCAAHGVPDVALRLEKDGEVFERSLRGAPVAPAEGIEHLLPPVGDAPWLRDRGRSWWSTVLAKERALYVQYNEVRAADAQGQTLAAFAAQCLHTCEEQQLERVILDLRSNGGGDNTTFGPLVETLCKAPRVNRRGRLFVLTSRETFSAAGNFVTAVDLGTEALLVGEPTGGAPNQYGDARPVTLSHHPSVTIRIVTRYHQFSSPDDPRLDQEPDLRVPLNSSDYFAGRDPVLQRALEYAGN